MNEKHTQINVTKSYLPPLKEYVQYLEGIWERNLLTNNGPLVRELESELKEFLGVKHLFFVSNGTIALQIAIKALELHGEIITTPFSYVATTSSIVWEGCQPVFVDIDPETLCINPNLIEAAITPDTTAILPTHVYGNPCHVDEIQRIADKFGLKVLYDAAHAFGVRYKDDSLASYGHASILSFHATKLFHTVEGGALVTNDDELAHRISYMRNFGHKDKEKFWGLGVNGKNSEFHAAMGLCLIPEIPKIIASRKTISDLYDEMLNNLNLIRPKLLAQAEYNYAYYPVLFSTEKQLLAAFDALKAKEIIPRRYFYPPLNKLPYVSYSKMPVAESVSSRVLCLPLYLELTKEQINSICQTLTMSLAE